MHRGGVARVAGLAMLWGSGFLWIKLALDGFEPIQIVWIRLSLGAVVLITWLYATGNRLPSGIQTWGHLAIAALIANVAPYLLFAVGEQEVDSAVAGMLNATTPVWTVVIAFLVRLERRPTYTKATGFVFGFAGTVLIFSPWQGDSQYTSWGAVACLTAALSYAVSYVYMDKFLVRRKASPLALAAGQLGAASVLAGAAMPFLDGLEPPNLEPSTIASVIILGALGTGVAYLLNYRIIADDGATAASVVVYLLPVVAVALGAAVLHETPTSAAMLGTGTILVGVWLVRRGAQRANAGTGNETQATA